MDELQVTLNVWFFLVNLQYDPILNVPKIEFDVPKFFNNPTAKGTASLLIKSIEGIVLTENLLDHVNVTTLVDVDKNDEVFEICVYVPANELIINMDYEMDIGVNKSVPVYGEGVIKYKASNLKLNFCTTLNYNKKIYYNTQLNVEFRHNPMTITGLYRNVYTNKIILNIANYLNYLLAMWNYYEPKGGSCILGPIFEFILNAFMENDKKLIEFDTACFEDTSVKNLMELIKNILTIFKY